MADPLKAWVDGAPATTLPVSDRGLAYGDGVFETVRIVAGRPWLWTCHWRRLRRGCERLALDLNEDALFSECGRFLGGVDGDAVFKLIVTRGSGGRGYASPGSTRPTRVLLLYPLPAYAEAGCRGVRVTLCRTRLARQPALAGVKHLNRLEQVLARAEWDDPEIAEGLMLDTDDRLVSGTMSNVFVVRRGRILTPPVDQCGVDGTVRRYLLSGRVDGVTTGERPLGVRDVTHAEECFLTNSVIGVWPVTLLETPHGASTFRVGTMTRRVRAAIRAQLRLDPLD